MSTINIKQKHPLLRDGSTRIGRLVAALAPDSFKLDDRSIQDLIVATHRYAKLLSWHDAADKPDGDWACFWETETLTYLAVLSAEQTGQIRKEYDDVDYRLGALIESDAAIDTDTGKTKMEQENDLTRELLRQILGLAAGLQSRLDNLVTINHPMKTFLAGLIEKENKKKKIDTEELAGALAELAAIHKGADDDLVYPGNYDLFSKNPAWAMPDQVTFDDLMADPDASRERLRGLFIRFFNSYLVLKNRAQREFDAELRRAELPETVEYRIMQPHVALYIAFLRLFHHAQNSLNGLVKKQLDFYYEQVLGLSRRPAVPDSVPLIFTLAKNFEPQEVEKGTLLLGGKDKNGRPLFYETMDNWVVGQAKVEVVKSFYLPSDPTKLGNDFDDQAGKFKTALQNGDLLASDGSRIFSDKGKTSKEDLGLDEPELGFVIASPQLLMQEGLRMAVVEITEVRSPIASNANFGDFLDVQFSTKEGWSVPLEYGGIGGAEAMTTFDLGMPTDVTTSRFEVFPTKTGDSTLSFVFFLPKDFPPVVAIEGGAMSRWPAVKIVLKKGQLKELEDGGYKNLIAPIGNGSPALSPKQVNISTRAQGVSKNLILQSDLGVSDGTQQLMPFGPTAAKGARFYVGFAEAFLKKLDSVVLKPNWTEPLAGDLSNHYTGYNFASATNDFPNLTPSSSILSHLLQNNQFDPLKPATGSLSFAQNEEIAFIQEDDNKLKPTLPKVRDLDPGYVFDSFNPSIRRGFIRLTFNGELLHEEYPKRLGEKALRSTAALPLPLPVPPYTPTFNSMELDYVSKGQPMQDGLDEFIYLHPFDGFEKVLSEKAASGDLFQSVTLFKDFLETKDVAGQTLAREKRGHLYIGMSQLVPGSSVSLLLQMKEGTERDTDSDPPDIEWAVMTKHNRWQALPPDKLLHDSTNGLTRRGTLRIAIPQELSSEGCTVLDPALFWLRATATEFKDHAIAALPEISYLHAQVIKARFRDDQTNDYAHLAAGQPAGTISKLAESRSAIKKVEQPFLTFDGRLPESEGMEFYVRISERLRHRDRAVTVWDYEHILLENFTDVATAKCIPHTQYRNFPPSELAPGFVAVAVVPDLKKRAGAARDEPRFPKGYLDDMRDHLAARATMFLTNAKSTPLVVTNAQFEQVRVEVRVVFRPGDEAFFRIKLEKELKSFLSPWLVDENAAPVFGRNLRRSQLIGFIDEREYVDFIDFGGDGKGFQIFKGMDEITGEMIRPETAHGILCTAANHLINPTI